MIAIATGFICLSLLSIVSTMVMWERSQWLWKNIVWSTGYKELLENIDRCTGHRDITEILLKMGLNTIQSKLNSLSNNKILDMTKLKAFADDKLNIAKMTISVFDRVENTVWKGENAGYQHFLLFLQCFSKPSFTGSSKVGIVW